MLLESKETKAPLVRKDLKGIKDLQALPDLKGIKVLSARKDL